MTFNSIFFATIEDPEKDEFKKKLKDLVVKFGCDSSRLNAFILEILLNSYKAAYKHKNQLHKMIKDEELILNMQIASLQTLAELIKAKFSSTASRDSGMAEGNQLQNIKLIILALEKFEIHWQKFLAESELMKEYSSGINNVINFQCEKNAFEEKFKNKIDKLTTQSDRLMRILQKDICKLEEKKSEQYASELLECSQFLTKTCEEISSLQNKHGCGYR